LQVKVAIIHDKYSNKVISAEDDALPASINRQGCCDCWQRASQYKCTAQTECNRVVAASHRAITGSCITVGVCIVNGLPQRARSVDGYSVVQIIYAEALSAGTRRRGLYFKGADVAFSNGIAVSIGWTRFAALIRGRTTIARERVDRWAARRKCNRLCRSTVIGQGIAAQWITCRG
jgi:hypothetical protein